MWWNKRRVRAGVGCGSNDQLERKRPERRPIPLLLWTDYGGGPLWCRSPDNKASGGISPESLRLSESLCARLRTWTERDYHLWNEEVLGYEFDDPDYDRAWHDEGLALLSELRAELGPGYDVRFKHELDA